jgi:hypothetical protein
VFEVKVSDEEELMENLRKQQDLGAVLFGGIPDELLCLGQILRAAPRTVHLQQSDFDFHPHISSILPKTSPALSRGRGLGHVDRGHQIGEKLIAQADVLDEQSTRLFTIACDNSVDYGLMFFRSEPERIPSFELIGTVGRKSIV